VKSKLHVNPTMLSYPWGVITRYVTPTHYAKATQKDIINHAGRENHSSHAKATHFLPAERG
jgi:hypothetical protein